MSSRTPTPPTSLFTNHLSSRPSPLRLTHSQESPHCCNLSNSVKTLGALVNLDWPNNGITLPTFPWCVLRLVLGKHQ
ncbi:hypothetical protein J6590_027338 [Homalodisca vitripennis]|nr:hypothetical protein J6590_027338 [Homalodisca vitripennis]